MQKLGALLPVVGIILIAGCGTTSPTSATGVPTEVVGTCATVAQLTKLADQVFGSGSLNAQSVIAQLNDLNKFISQGDTTDAQAQAKGIVTLVQQQASAGTLVGTATEVNALIGGVLCNAGLSPNTFLIQPTDSAQVLTTNSGNAGVSIQGHTVGVPTLLTVTELDPNGPSGLQTKLDQYPTFISITSSSQLAYPVVVAVCIPASLGVPPDVFERLRIGHQASTGFEVTPPADPSFLGCPTNLSASSRLPHWLRSLASVLLPKKLYARTMMASTGGVGGSATEFSPFGAVDNGLFATGGVGGSVIEFQRSMPSMPSAPRIMTAPGGTSNASPTPITGTPAYSVYDANGNCISADTTVGAPLSPACRPLMTVRTAKGTLLSGVPFSWTVTAGGGTIATDPLNGGACGAFGSSAANATDNNGKAGVCWTLGPNAGSNTVTATPSPGGDAPAGVVFLDGSGNPETGQRFTATGDLIAGAATANGVSILFDGSPHPGTGSCSNGATPALGYSTTDGSAPVNVGSYTLTVTCNTGSTVYAGSSATATIAIGQVTPSVVVTCPASVVFTGSPLMPCSATVTAPGLSVSPTPTYTNNVNAGTATASYNYAAAGNYAAANGSTSFSITGAAAVTFVNCIGQVYAGSPIVNACTATVTFPGGLSQSLTPVTYSNNLNVGTASASATYPGGSNYPPSTGSGAFVITRAGSITTVTCPVSIAYTGANQNPCAAVATGVGGLATTLTPTYTPAPARTAGSYTASETYGGDANHNGSSGTGSFTITPLPATATAGSGTMTYGGAAPSLPCVVTGLLAVDAGTVTCTTAAGPLVPGINSTAPVVLPSNPVNYSMSPVTGTFTVQYLQSSCFQLPVYSSPPPISSFQPRSTAVLVECSLEDASGSPVSNATGNLTVTDMGATATGAGTLFLQQNNAFTAANGSGGNHAYGYSLSTSAMISGHYYRIAAAWNDGSTTTGWIYVRQK